MSNESPLPPFPSFDIAAEFLAALDISGDGADAEFAWQTTDDTKGGHGSLIDTPFGPLRDVFVHLSRLNTSNPGAGIHVCLHETDGQGRTEENMLRPRAVAVDFDENHPPYNVAMLPVSMVVESARGPHLYWLLKPGEDLHQWKRVQLAMAQLLGGDTHATKITQTMRVPGFFHNKAERKKVWLRICEPHLRYTLEELIGTYGLQDLIQQQLDEEEEAKRRRAEARPPRRHPGQYHNRIQRARACLDTVGGEGEGNRNEHMARKVAPIGWRFGIDVDEWVTEAVRWNESYNKPPLRMAEVQSVVRSMYRKLQRTGEPFGSALDEDTEAWKQKQREYEHKVAERQAEEEARWQATLSAAEANLGSPPGPGGVPDDGSSVPGVRLLDLSSFKYEATPTVPDGHPLSVRGNAGRFLETFGERVRFCPQLGAGPGKSGQWFVWTGTRWKKDDNASVCNLAQQVLAKIHHLSNHTSLRPKPDESKEQKERREAIREAISKHVLRSEEPAGVQKALVYASWQSSIQITPDQMDTDDYLVNTPGGIVDIRDLTLAPHDPALYQTRLARVPYKPKAKAELWDGFLRWAMGGDEEMIGFLQRAAGASFTGSAADQVFYVCYGTGGNGKSTFIGMLLHLAAEYGRVCDFNMFLQGPTKASNTPNEELLALKDIRLLSASEPDEGARLREGLIKQITSTEPLSARPLWGKPIEFPPKFTLWLSTNHRPAIRGTDDGIWRRVVLIPWRAKIPDGKKDLDLPKKLGREAEGIFRWVIDGANAWYRDGLQIPESVQLATKGYRQDMDTLGDFLDQRCVVKDWAQALSSDLYEAYKRWCEEQNERPFKQKTFSQRLAERGFERRRTKNGIVFPGLGLLDAKASAQVDESDDEYAEEERRAIRELDGEAGSQGELI